MAKGIKREIVDFWTNQAPEGLSVSDISNKYIREQVAQLMENQKTQDLGSALNEDFGVGVGAPLGADQGIPHGGDAKAVFAPVSLALVRRVFPQLFANVLVGVQALQGPVGLAYAMRYVYKDEMDKGKIVEAAWKAVPEYSGFTGSQANTSGPADTGIGVDTQNAEGWSVQNHNNMGKIPELGLMFSRQAIVARTRKIAASFSLESIDDIKKMQGVDMVNEMVNVLQYELTAELDRETIARCKALCKRKELVSDDSNTESWSGRWSQERLSNIVTHIIAASNEIAVATRRAPANIAVVSPSVATALQSATQYFNKITTDVTGSTATPEVGSLNGGSIKVYRDNYAVNAKGEDNEEVLLAYKGASNDDAGVIFCPYVTGVVNQAIDPNDFSPRIGIMTRYAFANNMLGADNYYRLLKFTGLTQKVSGNKY